MNEKELFLEIPLSELPQSYQIMINLVGRENTFKIAKEFGGERTYLQRLDSCLIPIRDRKIIQEYKGFNAKDLGRKYSLTSTMIHGIVKREKAKHG